jgi:hypothetical protein
MKGIININLNDDIEIYIKASNLQGIMEGTIKRKNWDELLNKNIEIDVCREITIEEYNIDDSTLKIKMKMRKDTGIYKFDLELKNNGDNIYSSKLGGPDIFTWSGIILNLTLTPFIMIYNKLFF